MSPRHGWAVLSIALLASLLAGLPACAQTSAEEAAVPAAPQGAVSVSAPVRGAPLRYLPSPPKQLSLCGEPVPLHDREVAEMLEREFILMVNDQAQVVMWLKRAARYFPYIQSRLAAEGLPDDLKYLAVAESSLLTRIVSPAGATGTWQFIEGTGRRYGLRRDTHFDDRRNPELATTAAMAYLKDLYKMFGSWSLAMAAYNCGERRVQNELAEQGVSSYYDLWLPQETMRYVFRILAIKILLSSPETYGYQLPPSELYQPLPADVVRLDLVHALHLRQLAQATGTTVRKLKELNPELSSYALPKGQHRLKVPQGQGAGLEQRLAQQIPQESAALAATATPSGRMQTHQSGEAAAAETGAASAPAPAPAKPAAAPPPAPAKSGQVRSWVVQGGQTLSGIAHACGVSIDSIRKANNLGNGPIKAGQKLVIPGK